jgi:hypothetical protein
MQCNSEMLLKNLNNFLTYERRFEDNRIKWRPQEGRRIL